MSDSYYQLLDAAIQHLEALRARGVRFVAGSPEGLAELTKAPGKSGRVSVSARQPEIAASGTTPPAAKFIASRSKPEPALAPDKSGAGEANDGGTLPVVAPAGEAMSQEAKLAAFAELRQRAMACVKCPHLASARKQVVFGVGDMNAELMFVGEAPGADEDRLGEPFVGRAGQLLTRIIEAMGLRRESVYIGNILKCRPDTPGQVTGNRKPTPEEMQTCIPFLHEQIDLVRPKVLVALGGTAVEGLLGNGEKITRLRGNWRVYRGIPLMPTYHPSFLLHQQVMINKRQVWEDMMKVMEKLGMPISEKQRNFFLKA